MEATAPDTHLAPPACAGVVVGDSNSDGLPDFIMLEEAFGIQVNG